MCILIGWSYDWGAKNFYFDNWLFLYLPLLSCNWPISRNVPYVRVHRAHEKALSEVFCYPVHWSCCTAWFGLFFFFFFVGASFYVCVLWTKCLTELWGSFMSECCLKCSSYAVVACFGGNATSKCLHGLWRDYYSRISSKFFIKWYSAQLTSVLSAVRLVIAL